jgi:hypothetical protein
LEGGTIGIIVAGACICSYEVWLVEIFFEIYYLTDSRKVVRFVSHVAELERQLVSSRFFWHLAGALSRVVIRTSVTCFGFAHSC